MSGVICDRRISASVKGKVYKVVVRHAMMYSLEIAEMTKTQQSELQVAVEDELKTLLG